MVVILISIPSLDVRLSWTAKSISMVNVPAAHTAEESCLSSLTVNANVELKNRDVDIDNNDDGKASDDADENIEDVKNDNVVHDSNVATPDPDNYVWKV